MLAVGYRRVDVFEGEGLAAAACVVMRVVGETEAFTEHLNGVNLV